MDKQFYINHVSPTSTNPRTPNIFPLIFFSPHYDPVYHPASHSHLFLLFYPNPTQRWSPLPHQPILLPMRSSVLQSYQKSLHRTHGTDSFTWNIVMMYSKNHFFAPLNESSIMTTYDAKTFVILCCLHNDVWKFPFPDQ